MNPMSTAEDVGLEENVNLDEHLYFSQFFPRPLNNVYITNDVILGANVKLSKFINLYGCSVGDNTKIGAFVEVQKNAHIGKNCKNLEPYLYLRGRPDRRRSVRRPRRHFYQR